MNKANMMSSQRADAEALWMIRSAVLACAEGGQLGLLTHCFLK